MVIRERKKESQSGKRFLMKPGDKIPSEFSHGQFPLWRYMTPVTNPTLKDKINFQESLVQSDLDLSEVGVKNISEIFNRQIRTGLHPGAQLVVLKAGQIVVDRFGGYIDTSKTTPVTPETRFLTFSVTKPLTSACVFRLIDKGLIKLDSPVGEYWPEFSCNGKEEITIRQVLLHQSGLPKRGIVNQIINISNLEKISGYLAEQKPEFQPGTKTAYQYLNFGFILGEVVNRVSGLRIDDYLKREFLNPMAIRHTSMSVAESEPDAYAQLCSGTLDHQLVAGIFNLPSVRKAVIPAASLHSTARELAIFFQMLLNEGEYAGERYLESETVQFATSLGYEGFDESISRETRWGYGFSLGGEHTINPDIPDGMGYGSSVDTFGHFGQRTSMVWADKRTRLVVAFLCNRFLSSLDYKIRLKEISDAVWDMVKV
jgi:CubicO group peptidase (beta-lactamase class C family)